MLRCLLQCTGSLLENIGVIDVGSLCTTEISSLPWHCEQLKKSASPYSSLDFYFKWHATGTCLKPFRSQVWSFRRWNSILLLFSQLYCLQLCCFTFLRLCFCTALISLKCMFLSSSAEYVRKKKRSVLSCCYCLQPNFIKPLPSHTWI